LRMLTFALHARRRSGANVKSAPLIAFVVIS
jgi:hypothetical protein